VAPAHASLGEWPTTPPPRRRRATAALRTPPTDGLRALTRLAATLLLAAVIGSGTARAGEAPAVKVTGASVPAACAEEDNVTLAFAAADVRRFAITAAPPAYLGSVTEDSFAPDWTGCSPSARNPPVPAGEATRTTLYERIDLWVVGLTFPSFWRPATATVRIG